jgi:hypothetical protein
MHLIQEVHQSKSQEKWSFSLLSDLYSILGGHQHIQVNRRMKNEVQQCNPDGKDLRYRSNASSCLFRRRLEYPASHPCERSQTFSLFHLHVAKPQQKLDHDHDL